jgi:protein-L-isoaspartate(D-aspartate) O-methyltransferase
MSEGWIDEQLVARGIRDARVVDAMRRVPREAFVPEASQALAYADRALPIPSGQTISQPFMVAVMTEALMLEGGERVLEIGTGSGYQAAILAELAAEVITIERRPELADAARSTILSLGYTNVEVIVGDGTLGLPGRAPFDRILVTAGAPRVPEALTEQLSARGGRLVIPVGPMADQELRVITKTGAEIGARGQLHAAWLFYIVDEDGINSYATVVDDGSQTILSKRPTTFFQSPPKGLR